MAEQSSPTLSISEFQRVLHARAAAGRPAYRRGAAAIASPADGMVSECGAIQRDHLLQAKNRRYALDDLLAQQDWAGRFEGGSFATIYLAPFNYHAFTCRRAGGSWIRYTYRALCSA